MSTSPSPAPLRGLGSQAAAFADCLAILVFAILARLAHNTPEMPFGFKGVMETAWPFLLGGLIAWAVIEFLLHTASRGHTFAMGAIVWVCSVFFGLLVWGIRHGAVPHWSFMIVASVMSAVLLLGWRAIASLLARRRP